MQVVQQSRDLFDAVLNGRLEIKKLRINASSDWLASPFLHFFFPSLPPPPPLFSFHLFVYIFFSLFFSIFSFLFPFCLFSASELSLRRARLIPGRKANFAS